MDVASHERVLSISELTTVIKELLEPNLADVRVEGEVSNLARPASGHVYLTLKDQNAVLRTVVYRGVAMRLRYELANGMQVVARGRLMLYAQRGEYQLAVEEIQPRGIGALELAFRQRKEKLFSRGYFEPARKKKLPAIPTRVCLVTSPTGSAVRDVLEVLARRWPAVEVWVYPVRVQGDEAAGEIAAAVDELNLRNGPESATPVDVLVLVRGGGSLEDLWPFNEEIVASAIFRSSIPVLTGIGHEDDLTIADLVADQRALTPSEAAERLVPHRDQVLQTLEVQRGRMTTLLGKLAAQARERLMFLLDRPCFRRPLDMVQERQRLVEDLAERGQRAFHRRVERATTRFQTLIDRLESLSPLKVLTRGFSVTRRQENLGLVRSIQDVEPGTWIVTELPDGSLVSRVDGIRRSENSKSLPRVGDA
ncbi:MAG: exodeoxyribonuclease VII large subunit [Gemmataceae bacterium]